MADNCSVTITDMQGEIVDPNRITPGNPYRFIVSYNREEYSFDHWENRNGDTVPMVRDASGGPNTDVFTYNVEDGEEYVAILTTAPSQSCTIVIKCHGADELDIVEPHDTYDTCDGPVYFIYSTNGDVHMTSQTPIRQITEMWSGTLTEGGSCYLGEDITIPSEYTFDFDIGPNYSTYAEIINETVVFTDDYGNTQSMEMSVPKNLVDEAYDDGVFHAACSGVYLIEKNRI